MNIPAKNPWSETQHPLFVRADNTIKGAARFAAGVRHGTAIPQSNNGPLFQLVTDIGTDESV